MSFHTPIPATSVLAATVPLVVVQIVELQSPMLCVVQHRKEIVPRYKFRKN